MYQKTDPAPELDDGAPAPPDDAEGESRGEAATETNATPTRTRRKRPAPSGKTKARNLHLSDDIHYRLWQYAKEKNITVSAAANSLLDKNLPRYEVKRVG